VNTYCRRLNNIQQKLETLITSLASSYLNIIIKISSFEALVYSSSPT